MLVSEHERSFPWRQLQNIVYIHIHLNYKFVNVMTIKILFFLNLKFTSASKSNPTPRGNHINAYGYTLLFFTLHNIRSCGYIMLFCPLLATYAARHNLVQMLSCICEDTNGKSINRACWIMGKYMWWWQTAHGPPHGLHHSGLLAVRCECLVPQGLSKCACCPSFEFFATLIGEMCMSLQF